MSGFPLFWRGQLLFCGGINKLRTNCCDEEEEEEEEEGGGDDDDHGDYDYCYEDEIHDPCDPYPVPQQWYIGSVCHWSPCDNYEMEAIDITLMGIENGCQQPNFIHYENWPLGDVVYELESSSVARQVLFKLYVDNALVSSTAVDVPPDEEYEYRSIAPEALTDTGAHHVRLLIQWEQDGYCEGQMRTRVAEIYTWCQAKPTVTFDDYVVYPGGLDERAQVQLAINKAEPDFDGLIERILGPYDTAGDADTVTDLFSDKIAHYAHACECPPDCGDGGPWGRSIEGVGDSGGEWVRISGGSGDTSTTIGCNTGSLTFSMVLDVVGDSTLFARVVVKTGDTETVIGTCEGGNTCTINGTVEPCGSAWVEYKSSSTSGYVYCVGTFTPDREKTDCRFNDTEDEWYGKWEYDTADCDAGVPANQDQLDHYNANCGGMASLLLGEMPERLV